MRSVLIVKVCARQSADPCGATSEQGMHGGQKEGKRPSIRPKRSRERPRLRAVPAFSIEGAVSWLYLPRSTYYCRAVDLLYHVLETYYSFGPFETASACRSSHDDHHSIRQRARGGTRQEVRLTTAGLPSAYCRWRRHCRTSDGWRDG